LHRKPPLGKSLAEVSPQLAKEWHPTKNVSLTPYDVTSSTHKKVWWKCEKGDDHEWKSAISSRTQGSGCSICRGFKVVRSNCLATLNPDLAKEWHPFKNESITPYDVSLNSGKKVWWKCEKGDDHEWKSAISSRTYGSGCSICRGFKVVRSNCLATLNPDLAKEWHPTKNVSLTPYDVTSGTHKKVWWKCEKGDDHEWQAVVYSRSQGIGCPACSGHKLVLSNCLATVNPKLSKQWHPTKNVSLTPYDVTSGTHKKVWWKCEKGDDHVWVDSISHRSDDRGCPVCSGHKVVLSNCLATLNPDLVKEWHTSKNGSLTPFDVSEHSNKKVWWKCEKGDDHEWLTTVSHRSNDRDCPYCTLTPQSKQELTITFELIQFFKINPKGFKTRVKGKLWTIDIYIPELHLGIEYDGFYYHKNKRPLDKLKTEKLEEQGFEIIRVRQEPLKAITDIDLISKKPFDGKRVTNDILKQIMKIYSLDAKRIQKIEKYLLKKSIQNERGLDDYIEMVLTEKAERKNNK